MPEILLPENREVSKTSALSPATLSLPTLPALFTPTPAAAQRTLEFFTANIRNPNTRRSYARAINAFSSWCAQHGLHTLTDIGPVHVAAYIKQLQLRLSAPSFKQQLAALRVLFDWLVVGQWCPPTRPAQCAGPNTQCARVRRRCWQRQRHAPCSMRSAPQQR